MYIDIKMRAGYDVMYHYMMSMWNRYRVHHSIVLLVLGLLNVTCTFPNYKFPVETP